MTTLEIQLIAVLFKVITLITSNPNIPQETKNLVINEIITVVQQEKKEDQTNISTGEVEWKYTQVEQEKPITDKCIGCVTP